MMINAPEELEQSMTYTQRMASAEDEVHLLAVVPASGDIPTKKNGQIVDGCTEFDLSPLFADQFKYEKTIDQMGVSKHLAKAEVLIGDRLAIITDKIASFKPELIIMGTELSSDGMDFFSKTKAGLMKETFDVPLLTYKCENCCESLQDIAILSDYEHDEAKDVHLVKEIAQRTKARITLFGFVKEASQREDLLSRMRRFSTRYELGEVSMEVIVSSTKEKSARALLAEKPIQLMVITDINRKGFKSLVKGNLEMDILNHTAIPILAI
jgi:hypothetical protein